MANKKAFRLDDISPDMDMDKFHRIMAIFENENIKPLIGIVPDCKDPVLHYNDNQNIQDFWNLCRRLRDRGWSISMHGYEHIYTTNNGGMLKINPFSEFAGMPVQLQEEKIKKGKEILINQKLDTDIFMAPGHSFDKATLKALKRQGFTTITDGLYKKNYKRDGIVFVPCRLQGCKSKGVDTICIHSNLYDNKDFEELQEYIKENRREIVDFEELLRERAATYGIYIEIYEFIAYKVRNIKKKAAASKKLERYMVKTYHKNKYIKFVKRVLFIPALLFKGIQ